MGIIFIARMAERNQRVVSEIRGMLQIVDITDDYLHAINSRIQLGATRLKVVVDCGNGTAGYIAPNMVKLGTLMGDTA